MKNIVLTGMPASGKSTVGVLLAKVAGYDFTDSDLVIQRRTGRKLSEIIDSEGIDGFLSIEEDVNISLAHSTFSSVIATGGSAVYGREAMEAFREAGDIIVWLDVPFAILEKRLSDIESRGVVLREGQTLRSLYEERVPLYEEFADFSVKEEPEDTPESILKKIMELLPADM